MLLLVYIDATDIELVSYKIYQLYILIRAVSDVYASINLHGCRAFLMFLVL